MNKTFEIFVGANNQTKKVELDKIITIIQKYYNGATISPLQTGIYEGEVEPSVIITIVSDNKTLKKFIEEIKEKLEQKEVGYRETNQIKFI